MRREQSISLPSQVMKTGFVTDFTEKEFYSFPSLCLLLTVLSDQKWPSPFTCFRKYDLAKCQCEHKIHSLLMVCCNESLTYCAFRQYLISKAWYQILKRDNSWQYCCSTLWMQLEVEFMYWHLGRNHLILSIHHVLVSAYSLKYIFYLILILDEKLRLRLSESYISYLIESSFKARFVGLPVYLVFLVC